MHTSSLVSHTLATPVEVASRLEEVTEKLKTAARPAGPESEDDFAASLSQLKTLCSALRVIALSHKAEDPQQAKRQQEQLKAIVAAVGQTVAELARANRRIAGKVGDQLAELEAIAQLPPGPRMVERLGQVVGAVRDAARDLDHQLDSLSAELRAAQQEIAALEHEVDRARHRALYDALTRALSRRAFEEQLPAMVADGASRGPWSLLLLDVDHFKKVNDRFGHIVGDALLFKLARLVQDTLRQECPEALFYRYGGEEFAIVVPGKTACETQALAERLRERVAGAKWRCQATGKSALVSATISIGVAEFAPGESLEALLARADRALYEGKKKGRNTVCVAESPGGGAVQGLTSQGHDRISIGQ